MSKIGLGCVTFGREIEKAVAFPLLDHAVEKGIFFWDTAAVYGNGASETIIGEWICNNPSAAQQISVSTKILPPYNEKVLEAILNESLIRLRRNFLDVLYLHNWHETAANPGVLRKISEIINKGVVGEFGLSNFNYQQLKQVLDSCQEFDLKKPRFIQNNYNFAVSDLSPDMVRLCSEHNIEIITYSPLGAGFLTGKHVAGVTPGSRFDLMPAHQKIYFTEQSQHRLAVLLRVSEKNGIPLPKLALAWAFDQPFVSRVLIGVREKRHIDQALEAEKAISKELKTYLDQLNLLTK